jgi:hypothetical protein
MIYYIPFLFETTNIFIVLNLDLSWYGEIELDNLSSFELVLIASLALAILLERCCIEFNLKLLNVLEKLSLVSVLLEAGIATTKNLWFD